MLEDGIQPKGSQRVGHNWRTNITPTTWSKIKPRKFASISFFGFQSLQLVCLLLYTIYSLLIFIWIAKRSNQSILKEVSPEYSLEGLMLKWKLQYLDHLMEELTHLKRPWCWERLKVGREGNDRGWDGWMASPTQWTWVWVNSGSWWWTGKPGMLQCIGLQRVGHDWVTELCLSYV